MDPKSTMAYQPSRDCCQNAFLFSKMSRPLLLCFVLLGDYSSDFARNQICLFKEMQLLALVGSLKKFFSAFPLNSPSHSTPCERHWLAHQLTKHWFQKLTICFGLFGWGCNKVIDGSHFELSFCPLYSVSLPELIACSPKWNCTARQQGFLKFHDFPRQRTWRATQASSWAHSPLRSLVLSPTHH